MRNSAFKKGRAGEEAIVKILQNRNLTILTRNFKSRYGEIDILAYRESIDTLFLFEVKTINSFEFESFPISGRQLSRIYKTLDYWLLTKTEYSDAGLLIFGAVISKNRIKFIKFE